jgi:hypothetical protein
VEQAAGVRVSCRATVESMRKRGKIKGKEKRKKKKE